MPFLNLGGNKNKQLICLTWISLWKIWKKGTRNRIRIHFGTGSGSTMTERWLRGSGSTFPNVDPRIRIRIHVKMRWIRNAVHMSFLSIIGSCQFFRLSFPSIIISNCTHKDIVTTWKLSSKELDSCYKVEEEGDGHVEHGRGQEQSLALPDSYREHFQTCICASKREKSASTGTC